MFIVKYGVDKQINYLNNVELYHKGDELNEETIIQYTSDYLHGIYNDTYGRWGGIRCKWT